MKRYSIKYIGGMQACAAYVPFAKDKVKNVVEKERKQKSIHSRSYSFSNGVFIKCTATKREFSLIIQASLGGLIFIGRNDTDPIVRQFQSDGFTHSEYANILPSKLSPYLAPDPTIPDNTGSPMPKYDWRSDQYTVYAGVGMQYAMPWYEKTGPDIYTKYFGYLPSGETPPTICNKSGSVTAQGVVGSESTGACVKDGYCIGISKRGELRAWLLSDPETVISKQINLPAWIGTEITLETSPGSGVYLTGYQGWLDGNSGIEWKFNKSGTKAVGLVYEIVNYGTDGTGEYTGGANYWRTAPHILIVELNKGLDIDGNVTFNPTVITAGQNLGICAVDWYDLDDTDDTLSYTFLNYDENISEDTQNYRVQLITYNQTTDITKIHNSFNIQVSSNSIYDGSHFEQQVMYYGRVTGIDLRYHTYSYNGTEYYTSNDTDDISYAKGFDDNVYKNQTGTASITDNYFDLTDNIDRPWSGSADITNYFRCRHTAVQYRLFYTGIRQDTIFLGGTSCAAMENNKKRFAYMDATINNNGEFYDAIQRNDILTTHKDVFSSFGYQQDTDVDGKVNAVFHVLGIFT